MLKQLTALSLSILLGTTSISMAQEATNAPEEVISSEMKSKQTMIETKGKIIADINQKIYNKSNDSLMREYVRNSNAMKKIMDEPTKNVDIKDKKALSEYMQDDIGLQKEIIQVKLPEVKEEKARPRAKDLLK